MTELNAKARREVQVFTAFANVSGLNIPTASIASCKEPMPDVSCTLNGTEYFFELAEVVPGVQAQKLSTEGQYTSGFPDPEQRGHNAMLRIIQQKQKKSYETGGNPVDLLLFFNRDFATYFPDTGGTPAEIDIAAQECKQKGPFTRIWTYCTWNNTCKLLA